jgi:hypothetical protein
VNYDKSVFAVVNSILDAPVISLSFNIRRFKSKFISFEASVSNSRNVLGNDVFL